jgi:hypothetical protein
MIQATRTNIVAEGRVLKIRSNMLLFIGMCSAIVFVAVALAFAAPARSASDSWTTRNDILSVSLGSDRSSYRVGDDVKIQVRIKNISSQAVEYFNGSPWTEVSLIVKDASGNRVEQTGAANPITYHTLQGSGARDLPAGQSVTLEWRGQSWSNLSNWGYSLMHPGQYTIIAVPHLFGFVATVDHMTESERYVTGAQSVQPTSIRVSVESKQ